MYPYADAGIEDRKLLARENKVHETHPPPPTQLIRAWILRFGQNMANMCAPPPPTEQVPYAYICVTRFFSHC